MKRTILILMMAIFLLYVGCTKENKNQVPILITSEISGITGTSAISGGTITSEGSGTVIARGVCWSTGSSPTIADSKTSDGAGAGNFTSNLINLLGGTSYFVRAYATNNTGTGYGMAFSFSTLGNAPTVTTQPAEDIKTTSATLKGMVNANLFSTIVFFEYGTSISYGTSVIATQSPVTGNSFVNVSTKINGLIPETIYHFRVKAENAVGAATGDNLIFETFEIPVTFGIDTIDNTTYQTTTYFVYGFSFSLAKKVSTIKSPGPDIIVYDSPTNILSLQADNLNPSFHKIGDYPDSQTATYAFNNLKSVGTYQWTEMADLISDNQVWVYRSGTNCYAKLRIISTVNETRNNLPYGECIFEWVFQPNGSQTFP